MSKDSVHKSTTLKSPLGWVWGKSKLSKEIISLFPQHTHYVEVFGWGLSVLFAKESSKLETINDINNDLINFWRIISTKPQSLSHHLNQLFVSRVIFNQIKLSKYKPKSDIQRAAYFYYLVTQSFWSKGTHFAMTSKAWRKPKNLWKDFTKWTKRLQFVTVENMSFEQLLLKYDSKDTFFYLDPPYYNFEKCYQSWFTKSQHLLLRATLKQIKGKFLLSYNDIPEIRELYKDYNIRNSKEITYTLWKDKNGNHKKVSELYISNY